MLEFVDTNTVYGIVLFVSLALLMRNTNIGFVPPVQKITFDDALAHARRRSPVLANATIVRLVEFLVGIFKAFTAGLIADYVRDSSNHWRPYSEPTIFIVVLIICGAGDSLLSSVRRSGDFPTAAIGYFGLLMLASTTAVIREQCSQRDVNSMSLLDQLYTLIIALWLLAFLHSVTVLGLCARAAEDLEAGAGEVKKTK